MGYRVRKFAQRHRNQLLAAGLVIACLVAGIVVSLREAGVARANLAEARRLANVFVFDVHDAVRDLPGSTRARRLIVETGLRYLDNSAKISRGDWQLKAELANAYQRVGDVQGDVTGANLGNTTEALDSYAKAMSLLDAVLRHDPGNRSALLSRITVLRRAGTVSIYTEEPGRALASFRDAQKLGEALLAGSQGDPQAALELAQVYTATGDALWITGAFAASIDENAKAVTLLQKLPQAVASDPPVQKILAAAYSSIGMDQARLGRLDEALQHYRRALPLLENLTRQDPANASYQRALMSAYSHLGDLLGNPKWRSLGDAEGALKAYLQMLGVARRLHETDPANQQAASDYAIALTRVAAVMPRPDFPQRLSMLRESLQLLRNIQQINPQNVMNRWDLAHGYGLLGDALIASDRAEALRAYQVSVSLAEAMLAAGVKSGVPDLVAVLERLAVEAAKAGEREAALRHARRAFEISNPDRPIGKSLSENVQRFLTPRGSAAMGLAYAALAHAKSAPPDRKIEDRREARDWLQKSLANWRKVQADPAFAPSHKLELQQVEQALSEMNRL